MENPFEYLAERLSLIDAKLDYLTQAQTTRLADNTDDEILDVAQAATLLKYSKRTIYGKAEQGIIPSFKKDSRRYFVKSDLLTWIKTGKVKSDDDIITKVDQLLTSKRRRS